MRLIHCADIHLDSKLESNLTPEQAKERKRELGLTFIRMINYALEQKIDGILIAGDLFDTERISALGLDVVLNQIRRAEDIQFFYLRGNHDGSKDPFEGKILPPNLKTFGPHWTTHMIGNVAITGMELEQNKEDAPWDALDLPRDKTNIVMLHGQVSTQPGPEQIPLPLLRDKGIHYLALGHIHSYKLEQLDLDGQWCYCGCLEGRGFDECGEKGFVLLDIDDAKITPTFQPFASRQLYDVQVDITGLTAVTEILSAMESAAAAIPPSALVKFTLTGEYTLQTQKDLPFLKKALEPGWYFVKIKDESRLMIDKSSYEHDISLKGEFIRMVMASDRTDEEKEAIICTGIRALSGEEVAL